MKKIISTLFFAFITLSGIAQKAYTPQPGTSERKAIMDIFRKDFEGIESNILFKVHHLLINNNWACANVTPLKNEKVFAEPRWALFHKSNNLWKIVDWTEGITFQNDFEIIDMPIKNSRIATLIIEKYPSCPMDIFGDE